MRFKLHVAASAAILTLAGCDVSGARFNSKNFGDNQAVFVDASQRGIFSTDVTRLPGANRIEPRTIVCAEPSPDVAVAVASALQVALQASVSTVKTDVGAAFQVTRDVVESLVQLGKRTSTLQAMRQGLYQACQDYANGLMTDSTYAMVLARFSETLVTLFAIEGVTGMDEGTGGAGIAGASARAGGDAKTAQEAGKKLEEATKELNAKEAALKKAILEEETLQKTSPNTPELTAAQKTVIDAKADTSNSLQKHTQAMQEKILADATLARRQLYADLALVSGGVGTDRSKISGNVEDIHRVFMNSGLTGALTAACVAALDRDGAQAANINSKDLFEKRAQYEAARALAIRVNATAKDKAAFKKATEELAAARTQVFTTTVVSAPTLNPFQQACLFDVMPQAGQMMAADAQMGFTQGSIEALRLRAARSQQAAKTGAASPASTTTTNTRPQRPSQSGSTNPAGNTTTKPESTQPTTPGSTAPASTTTPNPVKP